jgi:hypothetical protein
MTREFNEETEENIDTDLMTAADGDDEALVKLLDKAVALKQKSFIR